MNQLIARNILTGTSQALTFGHPHRQPQGRPEAAGAGDADPVPRRPGAHPVGRAPAGRPHPVARAAGPSTWRSAACSRWVAVWLRRVASRSGAATSERRTSPVRMPARANDAMDREARNAGESALDIRDLFFGGVIQCARGRPPGRRLRRRTASGRAPARPSRRRGRPRQARGPPASQ